MSTLNLKVIVGSTRANRFSEKPAAWIVNEARKRAELDVELLDLRDCPLPFFEEAMPPGLAKDGYTNPVVVRWRDKIREAARALAAAVLVALAAGAMAAQQEGTGSGTDGADGWTAAQDRQQMMDQLGRAAICARPRPSALSRGRMIRIR